MMPRGVLWDEQEFASCTDSKKAFQEEGSMGNTWSLETETPQETVRCLFVNKSGIFFYRQGGGVGHRRTLGRVAKN